MNYLVNENQYITKYEKIYIKSNIKQCYDIPFLMTEKIPAYNFTQELVFHEWAAGLRERNYIILVLFAQWSRRKLCSKPQKQQDTFLIITGSIVLCGVVFTATL